MKTYEVCAHVLRFDMNYPICHHEFRKLNYSFMAAEAEWITNGDRRVDSITEYNKNIAQFSDDGLIFNGYYGEPFNNQLSYAVQALVNDINTRQSIIQIWHPNPVDSKDIKCTLNMQFLVRNGLLNVITTMRSSDQIWGLSYDMFNFTIMTLRFASLYYKRTGKRLELGHMTMMLGSAHIYERHFTLVNEIIENDKLFKPTAPVPDRAVVDWPYVVRSLVACRDKDEQAIIDDKLWRIRP